MVGTILWTDSNVFLHSKPAVHHYYLSLLIDLNISIRENISLGRIK